MVYEIKDNIKRIFKFVKRYWIVLVLTCIVGIVIGFIRYDRTYEKVDR